MTCPPQLSVSTQTMYSFPLLQGNNMSPHYFHSVVDHVSKSVLGSPALIYVDDCCGHEIADAAFVVIEELLAAIFKAVGLSIPQLRCLILRCGRGLTLSPMPHAISHAVAGVIFDKIYVPCCFSIAESVRLLQIYYIQSQSWIRELFPEFCNIFRSTNREISPNKRH